MASSTDPLQGRDCVDARRRCTVARVEFAVADGVCETLEGPVAYRAGDALLTGVVGERYPLARERLAAFYAPRPPTRAGEDGVYVRLPARVKATRLAQPQAVRLGPEGSEVQAAAGDWLVRYGREAFGVVRPDIFARTYAIEPRRRLRDLPWRLLSALYGIYIQGMHALGKRLVRKARHVERDLGDDAPDDDERARLFGNAYRGVGVLLGIIGIGLVLLSVASEFLPQVGEVDRGARLMLPALLLLLAGLLALARIKEEWIRTRARAERQRFRQLETLAAPTGGDIGALDAEVGFVLGVADAAAGATDAIADSGDQIAYNRERQQAFESILRGAKLFNRGMLAVSLLAAVASLVLSSGWLATLALAAPGLAGAVEGINGFLRLQDRAAEHAELAATLEALRGEYRHAAEPAAKRALALRIHCALMTDNQQWSRATRRRHGIL